MKKRELKQLLISDIDKVIEYLLENLAEDSFFDEMILIKARKSDLNRSINRGVLQQIEINIELNKIRGSVLNIINNTIEETISNTHEDPENINSKVENDGSHGVELIEADEGVEILSLEDEIDNIEIEEIGLLDVEDLLLETTQDFTENLTRISQITKGLGDGISDDASRLENVNSSNNSNKRMMQKNIINSAARTMNTYRQRMKIEIPLFETLTKGTIKYSMLYIQKVYEFGLENSKNEIDDYLKTLQELHAASIDSKISLLKMYEEIKKVPNMTSMFGISKRKVIGQLEVFFEIYDKFVENLESLLSSVRLTYLELSTEEK